MPIFESFATETTNVTDMRYMQYIDFERTDTFDVPDDTDKVKYHFKLSDSSIQLYRESTKEEKQPREIDPAIVERNKRKEQLGELICSSL